jgi:hypothetical protein
MARAMRSQILASLYLTIGMSGLAGAVYAQDGAGTSRGAEVAPNPSYDGRFTFARLRYAGSGCTTHEGPGWRHDYPVAERNLMKIMTELTRLDARIDSSAVFDLDDPELAKYPVAYLSEPGCWVPSESEVQGLRSYLQKGGFLIVDDFRGGDWENFERQMERVLPEGHFVPISRSDPVFNLFFGLDAVKIGRRPDDTSQFQGVYENDDVTKRLVVVANYNVDIGDYWQWSPTDFLPVPSSNQAYKFGVNYILYGLTH